MITFDVPTVDRLGLLAANAGKARELIVVDHHPSNTGFGTLNLVDPAAAATAVLAEELIHRLGVPLDRDIATCLYAGLVTDTGSFRYSSTTPAVHAMAARLLATGLRTDEIARELWDRSPVRLPQGARRRARPGRAGAGAAGGGLVWTYVTRADRAAYGLPYDEVEGVIDVVRRTDEAEVAVVLKEDDDGAWQVSTRSKGAVDVGRVCAALGGGGHSKAAGFTSHLPVERATWHLRGRCHPSSDRTPQRTASDGKMSTARVKRTPPPSGLIIVDKPAELDLPRRGGQAARGSPAPAGRPRGHARPDGHRRARGRRGEGDPAARPPRAHREGLRRPRSGSACPPTPTTPRARSSRRPRRRAYARGGVRKGVAALTGEIMQVPPQVSAIKVNGERAYKRARAGEEVELPPRPVTVSAFEVTGHPRAHGRRHGRRRRR